MMADEIPVYTVYVPGSITLDTGSGPVPQTDPQDLDAGDYDGGADRVHARLATMPGGRRRSDT